VVVTNAYADDSSSTDDKVTVQVNHGTVPEFGFYAAITLALIMSVIVVLSIRSGLKFNQKSK
jgi:hypothetical protein